MDPKVPAVRSAIREEISEAGNPRRKGDRMRLNPGSRGAEAGLRGDGMTP